MEEAKNFVAHLFFVLLHINSVNICHKVTHKYLEVIYKRWGLIDIDVFDTEKADEDSVVDYYGTVLDEEYVYYSGMADESTNAAGGKQKMWVRCRGQ